MMRFNESTQSKSAAWVACFLLLSLVGCGCSSSDAEPLVADAGPSQTVAPLELVTLDGSNSTGPSGFTYSWSYSGEVPEDDIDFQGADTPNPTFLPPVSAVYTFTLTIQSGDQTDTDEVTVQATGGLELSGTLTEDLQLIDIEPDAEVPDYVVTADLIVPDGITLSVGDDNVLVYFEVDAGLHVANGGTLTNYNALRDQGFRVTFSGPEDGWKGIWIENGTIELEDARIEYGGKTAFAELPESGAVILTGGAPVLESFEQNQFEDSHSYDLLVIGDVTGEGRFASNQLSFKNPVKVPVQFTQFWWSEAPNVDPEDVEYSIVIPSGADTKDTTDRSIGLHQGNTYLIDGTLWTDSSIFIEGGATVYMQADSAIVAEGGFSSGYSSVASTITGLDGAQWRGIAFNPPDPSTAPNINNTTLEDAGYGIIDVGNFTAGVPASLYHASERATLEDSVIRNGGGHGFYLESQGAEFFVRIVRNRFENLPLAAIRLNPESVGYAFALVEDQLVNEFVLDEGVPAVLIQGDGRPTDRWPDLGDDNFYLIDAELTPEQWNLGWRLEAGAHLKFKAGRSYTWNPPPNSLAAKVNFDGEADNPVILEGETDAPGSWGGVFLGGQDGWFEVRHTIIRNGGEFILDDATEKANVSIWYRGLEPDPTVFTNNTVSGSDGWGLVQEAGSFDNDHEGNGNTYFDNASGDVLKK